MIIIILRMSVLPFFLCLYVYGTSRHFFRCKTWRTKKESESEMYAAVSITTNLINFMLDDNVH